MWYRWDMVRQRQLGWIQGSRQLIACPTRDSDGKKEEKLRARKDDFEGTGNCDDLKER